jgi:hypothetical protein
VEGDFEKEAKENGDEQPEEKYARNKDVMGKVMVSDYASRDVRSWTEGSVLELLEARRDGRAGGLSRPSSYRWSWPVRRSTKWRRT